MTRSSDGIELTLFSKPQLLITKSAVDFAALNAALMEEIKPRDIIERVYVADIAALVWENLRLRRCKIAIVNAAFKKALSEIIYRLAEPKMCTPKWVWYEAIVRDWFSKPEGRKEVLQLLAVLHLPVAGEGLSRDERQPDQASRRVPCASAFLTSDCEIPNCLAIADGLTPALKAARTAFSLLVVNEPAPSSAASWRRCGFASATGFSFAGLGGRRPRRSASVVTAASSASISTIQPTASMLRPDPPARNGAAVRPGCPVRLCPLEQPKARPSSRSVEPKTGLVLSPQAAGLACPQLCRRWLTAATAGRAIAGSAGPAARRSEGAHIVGRCLTSAPDLMNDTLVW